MKNKNDVEVPKESRVRIQFDLRENRYDHLKELMGRTGIETNKELFENALTIMEWAVEEASAGNVVGVVDPHSGTFQKLLFTPLRRLAKNENTKPSRFVVKTANIVTTNGNQARGQSADESSRGPTSNGVASKSDDYHQHQSCDRG
jgi:hypothetical protein